ncbi:hypothetical protein PC116_g19864 [Phytophthora cactorum]|uniref:Uncharacterized protein n=1 Tax=Phytophthora cactorum TaxID=29920 RepID=A0A8T1K9B7_9STRA|nr:hypothetical protein Pcac1_g8854 [Phytophthora cactorum]KAG2890223.1 hypothetical protein PC114_g17568 [Phytophthora cactorum]KAG2918367.1 hypothetical protein PC117_g17090 [Phytophthora cactorum]KAG3001391.1 hypothetical protein PC119_g16729 [Phytophthora cactorum]KAG3147619.1 hypothetical protein C6341_g17692 [Phytophthora cactorum]
MLAGEATAGSAASCGSRTAVGRLSQSGSFSN